MMRGDSGLGSDRDVTNITKVTNVLRNRAAAHRKGDYYLRLRSTPELRGEVPEKGSSEAHLPLGLPIREILRQLFRRKRDMVMWEFIIYLAFVFVFFWVASTLADTENARRANAALFEKFLDEEFIPYVDLTTGIASDMYKKNFFDVDSFEELTSWFQGPVLDGLYPDEWYNGDPFDDIDNTLMMHSQVRIGGARIWQVRVTNSSCMNPNGGYTGTFREATQFFSRDEDFTSSKPDAPCYGPFIKGVTEETRPFGPPSEPDRYKYSSYVGPRLRGVPGWGINDYGHGGYAVYLPDDGDLAKGIFEQLLADRWYGEGTRAIALDFYTHSPGPNIVSSVRIVVEVTPQGRFLRRHFMISHPFHLYSAPKQKGRLVWEILIAIGCLYYVYAELQQCRRLTFRRYARSAANFFDLILQVSMIACISLWLMHVTSKARHYLKERLDYDFECPSDHPLPENAVGINSCFPDEFLHYSQSFQYAITLSGVCGLLLMMKMFKFMSISRRLSALWLTLSLAAEALIAFVFGMCLIVTGFAFLANMAFGGVVDEMHNFTSSFSSLLRYPLGDFDYRELMILRPEVAPFFFAAYVCLIVLTGMNVAIGMITMAYEATDMRLKREEAWKNAIRSFEWQLLENFRMYTRWFIRLITGGRLCRVKLDELMWQADNHYCSLIQEFYHQARKYSRYDPLEYFEQILQACDDDENRYIGIAELCQMTRDPSKPVPRFCFQKHRTALGGQVPQPARAKHISWLKSVLTCACFRSRNRHRHRTRYSNHPPRGVLHALLCCACCRTDGVSPHLHTRNMDERSLPEPPDAPSLANCWHRGCCARRYDAEGSAGTGSGSGGGGSDPHRSDAAGIAMVPTGQQQVANPLSGATDRSSLNRGSGSGVGGMIDSDRRSISREAPLHDAAGVSKNPLATPVQGARNSGNLTKGTMLPLGASDTVTSVAGSAGTSPTFTAASSARARSLSMRKSFVQLAIEVRGSENYLTPSEQDDLFKDRCIAWRILAAYYNMRDVVLLGHSDRHPFYEDSSPALKSMFHGSWEEIVRDMERREKREAMVAQEDVPSSGSAAEAEILQWTVLRINARNRGQVRTLHIERSGNTYNLVVRDQMLRTRLRAPLHWISQVEGSLINKPMASVYIAFQDEGEDMTFSERPSRDVMMELNFGTQKQRERFCNAIVKKLMEIKADLPPTEIEKVDIWKAPAKKPGGSQRTMGLFQTAALLMAQSSGKSVDNENKADTVSNPFQRNYSGKSLSSINTNMDSIYSDNTDDDDSESGAVQGSTVTRNPVATATATAGSAPGNKLSPDRWKGLKQALSNRALVEKAAAAAHAAVTGENTATESNRANDVVTVSPLHRLSRLPHLSEELSSHPAFRPTPASKLLLPNHPVHQTRQPNLNDSELSDYGSSFDGQEPLASTESRSRGDSVVSGWFSDISDDGNELDPSAVAASFHERYHLPTGPRALYATGSNGNGSGNNFSRAYLRDSDNVGRANSYTPSYSPTASPPTLSNESSFNQMGSSKAANKAHARAVRLSVRLGTGIDTFIPGQSEPLPGNANNSDQ